jgi:hypothetical protein
MVDKSRTIQQRTPIWWSWLPVQRHGFFLFQPPTPVASGEGVDQGRRGWVLLNNTNRPRKKYLLYSTILIFYTSYSTYNTPKMMVLRVHPASRSSHLPSILPSVAAACFLLIDGCVRPWFISFYIFFVAQFNAPNAGTVSPHALSRPRASALTSPLSRPPILG